MKKRTKYLFASVILMLFTFILSGQFVIGSNLAVPQSTAIDIKICPGTGTTCALWGLLKKSEGSGGIEIEVPDPTPPHFPNPMPPTFPQPPLN